MTPAVEQRSRRALRVAHRAELATFEAVESAFGGEEAESALVTCDDPGCPIADFNDIGFGHACSFAGMPALLSDSWPGLQVCTKMESVTGSGRRGDAAAGHALAHIADDWLVIWVSCDNLRQHHLPHQISGRQTNWSTKWVSNFAWETWQLFYSVTLRQRNRMDRPRLP